jgi:2'-hydroxyisoflavone reductase
MKPLARRPITFTWIEDYEWLTTNPVRRLGASVPWVMHRGNSLGHVQIDNRKAVAAGLKFRPLIETARDTLAWRESDAVPAALKAQPRYVLTMEQEKALLDAWKARSRG